jgi:hypothetical protein
MKTSTLASLALSASLLTTAGVAAAQPAYGPAALTAQTPVESRQHSVNISPLGLLGGGFNANYEYLSGRHGFLAEIGTTRWSSDYTSTVNGQVVEQEEIDGAHATVGIGYRMHFSGRQNSWFVGAMLHQNLGTASIDNMEDGRTVRAEDVAYRSTTLTANGGKRWMLGDHLNLTLRLGVGIAERKVIDDDADPMAAAELQDTIELPLAVDGELSLGWAF